MIRLNFHKPLTALEIREPALVVCREVAGEFGLYVKFHQPQQRAFEGFSHLRGRPRIGNGKHKNWLVYFQEDEPRVKRPTVVGRIGLKAPINPDEMEFGGFDYGEYGETSPVYSYITVHASSELTDFRPVDPNPNILEMTYEGLRAYFEAPYPTLFDVDQYNKA
jgi:hypothetical protein